MQMTEAQQLDRNAAATTAPATPLLSIQSVSKNFGTKSVLKGVSLDIHGGEFLTFLGESGSGKTTLLRLIAGFEAPTSGEIWMNGERIDRLPPFRRRVNTVFQQYALFPHLSVRDNVAYGLRIARTPKADIESRVAQALEMVKMSGYAAAMPSRISGGQQQRVALARALVNRPQLLLLDEPLSALDANLRAQMQSELKALQKEVGITFIFVTHDQQEAMSMSDRIALLRAGSIEQLATPREIYRSPATAYVAKFLGQTNLIECQVQSGIAACGSLSIPCNQPDGPVLLSLRPEAIRLSDQRTLRPGSVQFTGTITDRAFHGSHELVTVHSPICAGLKAKLPSGAVHATSTLFEFEISDAVFLAKTEAA
jgi:spermidine/putrescine transport system ATP-binding protein